MRVYFDSSAFAKRYVDEAGTAEVLEWCGKAAGLALSVLAVPEFVSTGRAEGSRRAPECCCGAIRPEGGDRLATRCPGLHAAACGRMMGSRDARGSLP